MIPAQVHQLHDRADFDGFFGWLAGLGTVVSAVVTLGAAVKETRILEYYGNAEYHE